MFKFYLIDFKKLGTCRDTFGTVLLFICVSLLIISCEQKSEYEQRVETELSKNTRVDSLFLGYRFGMSVDEFFEHSWNLNKQQVITGQDKIHYEIEELENSASMEFYPQFKDGKIFQMPVEVHYDGWAPWNRHLFADSLMLELVDLYKQKYNGDFFKTIHPENKKEAYIDIQANRRISIFRKDDRIVNVEFMDLTALDNNL